MLANVGCPICSESIDDAQCNLLLIIVFISENNILVCPRIPFFTQLRMKIMM